MCLPKGLLPEGRRRNRLSDVWGTQYVDELVQIGHNDEPPSPRSYVGPGPEDAGEDGCETFYYACHNANFNVMGIVTAGGDLTERYEYTPYGQRSVFKSPGSNDALCMAPVLESQRVEVSGQPQPYGLCDVGYQGLEHEKEFRLINNDARYLHPVHGRFISPDPLDYPDGMSRFESRGSNCIIWLDPTGYDAGDPDDVERIQILAKLQMAMQLYWQGHHDATWEDGRQSGKPLLNRAMWFTAKQMQADQTVLMGREVLDKVLTITKFLVGVGGGDIDVHKELEEHGKEKLKELWQERMKSGEVIVFGGKTITESGTNSWIRVTVVYTQSGYSETNPRLTHATMAVDIAGAVGCRVHPRRGQTIIDENTTDFHYQASGEVKWKVHERPWYDPSNWIWGRYYETINDVDVKWSTMQKVQ